MGELESTRPGSREPVILKLLSGSNQGEHKYADIWEAIKYMDSEILRNRSKNLNSSLAQQPVQLTQLVQAEEDAAAKKAKEDANRKAEEEEAAAKKATEDAHRKAEKEAAAKKAKEDADRKAEEEAAAKRKAKEEAAAKKAKEDAGRKAEKEAAAKKAKQDA